jgi:hypothetical protein
VQDQNPVKIVVNGGAGMSVSFASLVSIVRCVFDATGGADESETSAGLLVLFFNATPARVLVVNTVMLAPQVVFSVECADKISHYALRCPAAGLALSMQNSSILQAMPSSSQMDFNLSGSMVMTLQKGVSSSFFRARIKCADVRFAVFKNSASDPFSLIEHSCQPCLPFSVAAVSHEAWLDDVSTAAHVNRCFSLPDSKSCPFGVSDCQTFVDVSKGFWTRFESTNSVKLAKVRRCPRGYCGCGNSTCRLSPLISIDHNPDSLCSGNRTGTLCGGCPPNFTQSMDGVSCISNSDCSRSLWWVWTLSLVGFAVMGFLIVPIGKFSDGALSCILFYLQMSSFSSSSNDQNFITEYVQVRSVVATFFANACFARDMSAYDASVARLVGPVLVLFFSLTWTWMLRKLQSQLLQRNICIDVSYNGTIISATLFLFSAVASVVFALVECTSYADDGSGVVFIDGTAACFDGRWKGLVAVSVLFCLFPLLFAAALSHNKLSDSARAAVCRAFTERMFYWGAVTLEFRLLMSLVQFLRVDYPNLLAFVRSCLALVMLVLMMNFRPYRHLITFWVDAACYFSLMVQYGLQGLIDSFEFLGVVPEAETSQQIFFMNASIAIAVFR